MSNPLRRLAVLIVLAVAGMGALSPLSVSSTPNDTTADEAAEGIAVAYAGPQDRVPPAAPAEPALTRMKNREPVAPVELVADPAASAEAAPDAVALEATLVVVQAPPPAPVLLPVAAPPVVAAAPAPDPSTFVVDGSVWDRLAQCESGGNWAINTGNGYYGGLQFSHPTWHGNGGGAYAEYPHLATREQQIAVAERLHAARGFQPWPACRSKLGLP